MNDKRKRVVIVGGGFGGLEAAKALGRTDLDVVVIDRANYHLFQPLLYQVAMAGLSPGEIASPIRAILSEHENVRVVLGEVTRIDLDGRRVYVGDEAHAYDWLILALGAETSYFGHDEWETAAPGLKNVEDALEIRRRVLLAFERAERLEDERARRKLLTFVVIGGGPTGVELAGAIAELSHFVLARDFRSINPREARVVLVEAGPRILPSFSTDLSESAVEQLNELGVEVKTGARVVGIDEGGVDLLGADDADEVPGLGSGREHERIESTTVLWAAGVKGTRLSETLGVPLDAKGRVIVNKDCSLPGRPEVFAIGDMALFEENGKPLPGVSPVAMQQARYVAQLIKRESKGDGPPPPRAPFSYFDKGSMATIGRSRAIADVRGMKLRGFVAWLAWLFVHIWYLIGFRNRVLVLIQWMWSYILYARGARLITETGWHPRSSPPRLAPRASTRPPRTAPRSAQAPSPTS